MSVRDHLSDYLLGELSHAQRVRFESELAADAALAAEVERLRPVVEHLEALDRAVWEPAGELPPLPALPHAPQPAAPRRPWWRRRIVVGPLPAAALASVLLAVGVAAGVLLSGGGDEPRRGRVVALAAVPPLGGDATGTARLAGDRATVHLAGLPPSEEGEFYELWLLNAPDDLVSLGSFAVPASGEVDVTVPVPGNAGAFKALDVSLEPADGDPAHSAKSVLRAPL